MANHISRTTGDPQPPREFECTICCETFWNTTPLAVHDDVICLGCFQDEIKPRFVAALRFEAQYPVKWGDREIKVDTYRQYLDEAFVQQWHSKLKEYHTPVNKRIYCAGSSSQSPTSRVGRIFRQIYLMLGYDFPSGSTQDRCNNFLGSKQINTVLVPCSQCLGRTCACCETTIDHEQDGRHHVCKKSAEAREDDHLADLERGKDYQRCPKCNIAIELAEACNHMICTTTGCGTHFCYICGAAADPEQDYHFGSGTLCPLYGQPTAAQGPAIRARLEARNFWAEMAERRRVERQEALRQERELRRLRQQDQILRMERENDAVQGEEERRIRAERDETTVPEQRQDKRRPRWISRWVAVMWMLLIVIGFMLLNTATRLDG